MNYMISYCIEYCNIYAKLSTIITYYYHNIYNNERNITYAYILLSYIIYGTSQFTDKVTFSPTFRPGFFEYHISYLGLVSSLTKSHLVPHSDPGFLHLSALFVF